MESITYARTKLIELWSRVVKVNDKDKDKMYINGVDNLYPNATRRVIANSPTASRVVRLASNYIKGKGVADIDENQIYYEQLPIINETKGYKITDILSLASKDIAEQNGVYFHITYGISSENGLIEPKELDVLDYVKVRKSKEDDNGFEGMFIYDDFENKGKLFGNKTKSRKYYPFNNNQEILKAQILNDARDKDADLFEQIKDYKGQVLYLNLNSNQIYASSNLDPVYNYADTERIIGEYINGQFRDGFLGKTIFLTQGLDDEQAEQIQEELALFMGATNSSSSYHIDLTRVENLDNVLKVIQLNAQFDEKIFEKTKDLIADRIMGAWDVPGQLLEANDNALFSQNADAFNEYKLFFAELVRPIQEKIEQSLQKMGFNYTILPIINRENTNV